MIAAKDNPFATERVEALLPYEPEWAGTSWDEIDSALAKLGHRAAVIGPHGSGKTTFIETSARRLRERGERVVVLFRNRQNSAIPPEFFDSIDENTIILFDGAEQLGAIAWRRFLRRTSHARGLSITGHRPARLPTLFETKVTPAVLQRCIETLDPASKTGAAALFQRHRGNVRHALLECYDLAGA